MGHSATRRTNSRTEKEAGEVWCPYARVQAGSVSANRFSGEVGERQDRCLASGCGVWRWSYPPSPAGAEEAEPVGYCGAGGEP